MKKFAKVSLALTMVACLLSVLFVGASAANALDLMPTTDDGYTIVAGDGTVSVENGKMIITNNGTGDLRVTVDTKTAFDLTELHTLHMEFDADMSFKMAYHVVSQDGTSGWQNTSDNFSHLFEITSDRAAAGDYVLDMNLNEGITTITDRTDVHFEQFIILMTGKGTFVLNNVAMTDGSVAGDDETDTTTTTKQEVSDDAEEPVKTGDSSNAVAIAFIALASAVVIAAAVASKKVTAR
ncbi:MAG: hypothetical protein IKV35_04055 [Clostridia bacterium]|nr:hypothetical protein [Clostridia bacterium]